MPQIQWAINSYMARALPLSAQRLLNFYAEGAPKDAKSPVVLLNTPGIKTFCDQVGTGPIRGMEVMDGILYVVSGNELWSVKPGCDNTALGSMGIGADSDTSTIEGVTGATRAAESVFFITGGTDGGGTISSITVGGEEILPEGGVAFRTGVGQTAEDIVEGPDLSAPVYEDFSYAASSGRVTSFEASVPSGWDLGDLMIAQVGNGGVGTTDVNTHSGPVGWTEIDQITMSSQIYLNGALATHSIWFKFMAEGDGDDYTWTSALSREIQIAISRISGAARVQGLGPGLFPSAFSSRRSDGQPPGGVGQVPIDIPFVPSITPPSTQSLLLMLMGTTSEFAQSTRYVVDPLYPLQTKRFHRTIHDDVKVSIHCFSEEWAEFKATDTRTISTFSSDEEIVWHLSVSSWLTHPDYEIKANTEGAPASGGGTGSVVIRRRLNAGGTPEDFNGLQVVVTTTGDVTVECD